jgi:hypothetical protein
MLQSAIKGAGNNTLTHSVSRHFLSEEPLAKVFLSLSIHEGHHILVSGRKIQDLVYKY